MLFLPKEKSQMENTGSPEDGTETKNSTDCKSWEAAGKNDSLHNLGFKIS